MQWWCRILHRADIGGFDFWPYYRGRHGCLVIFAVRFWRLERGQNLTSPYVSSYVKLGEVVPRGINERTAFLGRTSNLPTLHKDQSRSGDILGNFAFKKIELDLGQMRTLLEDF